MPEIYPKVTRAKLKKGARKTSEGKGRAALPGVKTDAKHANATGGPTLTAADPVLAKISDEVRLEFERTFMFYLPRICEHCLNPACAASCPSGAI